LSPIDITLDGMIIDDNEVHPENVESIINEIFDGRLIEDNEVH